MTGYAGIYMYLYNTKYTYVHLNKYLWKKADRQADKQTFSPLCIDVSCY